MQEAPCEGQEWPQLEGRFQIKKVGAIVKKGLNAASCYLHFGIGVKAKKNLGMLHAMAAMLTACDGPWVLGGDFNCTPEQLNETGPS